MIPASISNRKLWSVLPALKLTSVNPPKTFPALFLMIVIVFVLLSQLEWKVCVSTLLPSLKQLWNIPNWTWVPSHLKRGCFWFFDNSCVSTIITRSVSYYWISTKWLFLYCFTPTERLSPFFEYGAFYNIWKLFLIENTKNHCSSLICIMQSSVN